MAFDPFTVWRRTAWRPLLPTLCRPASLNSLRDNPHMTSRMYKVDYGAIHPGRQVLKMIIIGVPPAVRLLLWLTTALVGGRNLSQNMHQNIANDWMNRAVNKCDMRWWGLCRLWLFSDTQGNKLSTSICWAGSVRAVSAFLPACRVRAPVAVHSFNKLPNLLTVSTAFRTPLH